MNIKVLNKYSVNIEILIKIKLFIITIAFFTIIIVLFLNRCLLITHNFFIQQKSIIIKLDILLYLFFQHHIEVLKMYKNIIKL